MISTNYAGSRQRGRRERRTERNCRKNRRLLRRPLRIRAKRRRSEGVANRWRVLVGTLQIKSERDSLRRFYLNLCNKTRRALTVNVTAHQLKASNLHEIIVERFASSLYMFTCNTSDRKSPQLPRPTASVWRLGDGCRCAFDSNSPLTETVLEAAGHVTQVAKATGPGGASPL